MALVSDSKGNVPKGNEAETIYDNEVSEDSYSLIPKTIDEEIIMPIDEIDLDEMVEEPVYNLSQSENTLYNNVIYDEASSDDVITPIYADEEYKEEHGITDEDLEEYYGFDLEEEEQSDSEAELDMGYITPEVAVDVESLPRPTSIASTNPISPKRDIHANLSRPHKKSENLDIPKPKAKVEAETPAVEEPPVVDENELRKNSKENIEEIKNKILPDEISILEGFTKIEETEINFEPEQPKINNVKEVEFFCPQCNSKTKIDFFCNKCNNNYLMNWLINSYPIFMKKNISNLMSLKNIETIKNLLDISKVNYPNNITKYFNESYNLIEQ